MAEYFLSKIRVTSADFVEAGTMPVLERHAELRSLLVDRAGPEVAALFAEPLISRGNDAAPPTVSWYGDRDGEARPLSSLPAGERDRAETYLSDHLRPLRALADDPASADLALGALSVYGQDDVLVQNGRPVIVNWGLLPDGQGANATARPAHYAATLGKYLPLTGAPAPTMATVGAPVPPTVAPIVAPVVKQRARISPIAWVPLLVLLLIAGGILAWLLMPGTRLFHAAATPPVITEGDALSAAKALNQSLRERQAELETALEGAVCRADGYLLLPDGRTPEGLLPPPLGVAPERKSQAAPDALLPSSPARVLVPEGDGDASLLQLIEARTVLILAATPGGVITGSGFVVGSGLVVTNFHVIRETVQGQGKILVTNKAMGTPRAASVLKLVGPMAETGADFALLQVEGLELPAFSLHVPKGSLKLTNVIAAGFPGDVLSLDTSFAALKGGDMSAVPDLTVTDGTVNTEQKLGPDTNVLMHSAPLSSGNSGGPLVDMCGRVVGVNTFVRQGPMQNRGFAIETRDLLVFLKGTDASPALDPAPCTPVIARPQVTSVPVTPAKETPAKE
jgi:S1-C subfamily serine protease